MNFLKTAGSVLASPFTLGVEGPASVLNSAGKAAGMQSTEDTTPYQNVGQAYVDRNAFQLGGNSFQRRRQNKRIEGLAQSSQRLATQDRGTQTVARGHQMGALRNMQSAAAGNTPSVAQLQAQRQLSQAAMQQASMVAGARGGGANMAAAQRNAAMAGAQLQGNAIDQGAILRAQEMDSARNAYMQGSMGVGSQALESRQLGNQTALQYRGLQSSADQAQLQARMQQEQLGSNNYNSAAQLNSGNYNAAKGLGLQQSMNNAANQQRFIGSLASAAGAAGGKG